MTGNKIRWKMGHGIDLPVFLTSLCTMLAVIFFLRSGYAVGNLGLRDSLLVILLGQLITIPIALAISEILTNLRNGSGGDYFIISRSYGVRIGQSIGIMLFAAQSVMIAFYLIGFTEVLESFRPWVQANILDVLPIRISYDPRLVSVPVALILFTLYAMGIRMRYHLLWMVLGLFLVAFAVVIVGPISSEPSELTETVDRPTGFISVFTVMFAAFVSMTAGSGFAIHKLRKGESTSKGMIVALVAAFAILTALVIKLYLSAPVDVLAGEDLVIGDLAVIGGIDLGWIVITALMLGTVASGAVFISISQRTVRAMVADSLFLKKDLHDILGGERSGRSNQIGIAISASIVMIFLSINDLDIVARIVTVLYLIIFGLIGLISVMEHFAGNPSYRPTFRTRWYVTLFGIILSFGVLVLFDPMYGFATLGAMVVIYLGLGIIYKESRPFSIILNGIILQINRYFKVRLYRSMTVRDKFNWRPSVIAITTNGMRSFSQKRMLKWISRYHGFGTLIHIIRGRLTEDTYLDSKRIEKRLVAEMEDHGANYTVKALVSPSMLTGVAQTVQLTGISGIDSNTIMFEFNNKRRNEIPDIMEGLKVAGLASYNKLVLRTTEHNFGTMRSIHLWIRPNDMNLNMMIMLAYIIMQNKEWKDSSIDIFALRSRDQENRCENFITSLINERRIPFSRNSIHPIYFKDERDIVANVNGMSSRADLTLIGFNKKELEEMGSSTFTRFDRIQETLFVNAVQDITFT